METGGARVKIAFGKQAEKYLVKCDKKTYDRLKDAIDGLLEGGGDIVKLQGKKDTYRLKKPPYRIIFRVDEKLNIIYIEGIYPRGDAYKKG